MTAFNDWTKEKQFRNLQNKLEHAQIINVIRDGEIKQLEVKELLVGDICELTYGNIVPCDGLVIQSYDLNIDESILTGESHLVKKSIENPILFSGKTLRLHF